MFNRDNSDFNFEVDPNFDFTIDESGNKFIALRKISWNGRPAKLDLRSYYSKDGAETMSKGVSFLTEEGPHELTKVLVENGYGYTDDIINGIKGRADFKKSLTKCLDPSEIENLPSDEDDEFFDPKLLLSKSNLNTSEDDDDE